MKTGDDDAVAEEALRAELHALKKHSRAAIAVVEREESIEYLLVREERHEFRCLIHVAHDVLMAEHGTFLVSGRAGCEEDRRIVVLVDFHKVLDRIVAKLRELDVAVALALEHCRAIEGVIPFASDALHLLKHVEIAEGEPDLGVCGEPHAPVRVHLVVYRDDDAACREDSEVRDRPVRAVLTIQKDAVAFPYSL